MPEVIRNRKIRPSTRKESSKNYKIQMEGISPGDTLVVNIDHESKPFRKTYKFRGSDVLRRKSLGFTPVDYGTHIEIIWRSTQPISES